MSKRKNRTRKPNLPKATLDRARLQAEGVDVDEMALEQQEEEEVQAEEVAEAEPQPAPAETAAAPAPVARRTPRREDRGARRRGARTPGMTYNQRKNKDELDHETIRRLLINPTKEVTEEELRADYGYVLNDIRNMLILTVFMVTLMVVLGLFI
jgi:hypothetical protein